MLRGMAAAEPLLVRRCPVDEAVDLLAAPDATESLSLAHGVAALVVEGADEWPEHALTDRQQRVLEWLPCVTVAPTAGPSWRRFDVVADEGTDAGVGPDELVASITASPEASTALVRLVRAARRSDPLTGLWAESVTYGLLQAGTEFAAWQAARSPADPGPPGTVRVERSARGVEVILDRPGRHNALDVGLRDDLVDVLRAVAAGGDDEPVVLSGRGPSFCSGGDLGEFGSFPDPVAAHLIRSARLPARAVLDVRHRLTVEVHGACVGAGVELAAFAARVVADPSATFRLPEVGMGLVPGSGGTWSLTRRIGAQRTNWLALSGASIGVALAERWGLVDAVSPAKLSG